MKYFLLISSLFFFLVGCAQSKTKPITEVSQNEFNNVILVDVRTPEEYESGHIEKAININWFDSDFEKKFASISKDETIYVYCKAGGRSLKAQEKLKALGYLKVVNLEGGHDAYSKK